MKVMGPLAIVVALAAIAWVCTAQFSLYTLFGVILPYAAFAVFAVGFVARVVRWCRSAVPFRIPTTAGQQASLPWIKQAKLDNPSTKAGVFGRMLLEVLFFRSLFRNSASEKAGGKLVIGSAKWLWLFALMFHWSMLVIVLRHFRLSLDPVPAWVSAIEGLDGMFQVGVPILYLTDLLFVGALTFLFLRRVVVPRVRYLSHSIDYLPLFLLLGIGASGMAMRYVFKVDIAGVKELAMGLVSFHPVTGTVTEPIFYVHVFLVCCLLAYFPFSKLMHAGGVFLSPTRNMANDSRARRHVNPWNYPVQTHAYAEYEDEFGDKMRALGLPLEHDSEAGSARATGEDSKHADSGTEAADEAQREAVM